MKTALSLMAIEGGPDYEPHDVDLDPIFVGLICKLPARGSKWTKLDRDRWMSMLYAIADALHPESTVDAPVPIIERAPKTTVEHQTTEITKITHESKRTTSSKNAIPAFVQRVEPNEEQEPESIGDSTRGAILRVLRAADRMLSGKEIWESDDSLDETQCYSQLSHMTLRKGWLKREKRGEVYVYQVNEQAQIPEYV